MNNPLKNVCNQAIPQNITVTHTHTHTHTHTQIHEKIYSINRSFQEEEEN